MGMRSQLLLAACVWTAVLLPACTSLPTARVAPLRLRGGSLFSSCFPQPPKSTIIYSKEVAGSPEVAGEGKARRNSLYEELVAVPFKDKPDLNTPFKCFKHAAQTYPDHKCLGHRAHLDDGKRGDYVWETYAEVLTKCETFGHGLNKLCGIQKGGKCGIYSINRPEWTMSALAMWSQSMVCVPLYDSVGVDAVKYIVNHASLPLIVCQRSKLQTLLEAAKDCRSLKHVVLFEDLTQEDHDIVNAARKDMKLMSMKDVIAAGVDAHTIPHSPSDLSTILYTSGTTGDPKGVMLTAKNQLASAAGCILLDKQFDGSDIKSSKFFWQATYISYLPLAHSFELNMQILVLLCGSAIGFYQGDVRKLVTHDLPVLKPTIMPGVPRVFSRIYEKVTQGIEAKGAVTRLIFNTGFSANQRAMRFGDRAKFWDKIIFSKLQGILGGRVRLFLTGAAPMSSDLHQFLKVTFNAPVAQGYGMTENAGAAMAMYPEMDTYGTVGPPIPCTEVKLIDVPEMDYTSQDKYPGTYEEFEKQVSFKGVFEASMAGAPIPRGEILLRGPNVMMGYLKLEAETASVLDSEGWIHTGDIGQWNTDGSMSIIDRKKNIFKLAQGEYIAVERVENAVSKSKYVLQGWIYGNSFETALVAVIAPDKDMITQYCNKAGIKGSLTEQCNTDEVRKLIYDDVSQCAKSSGLRGYECPKAIYIETQDLNELGQAFYVSNDLLTPSFKLRRPQLLKKYHSIIDEMYTNLKKEEANQKNSPSSKPP